MHPREDHLRHGLLTDNHTRAPNRQPDKNAPTKTEKKPKCLNKKKAESESNIQSNSVKNKTNIYILYTTPGKRDPSPETFVSNHFKRQQIISNFLTA